MKDRYVTLDEEHGRSFKAYLVTPERSPAPAVLLLQEIFGVNGFMRDVAQEFANAGYLAVVPDLFWRQEAGVELDPLSEADRQKAMQLFKQMSEDMAVRDAVAAMTFVRELPECNGKIATVGYCMGGKLAYLMAVRSSIDAAVSYYGVGIQAALSEARAVNKPLMLHLAGEDHLCPRECQSAITQALAPLAPLVTTHVYPAVGHAFARVGSPAFDGQAARTANERTLALLGQLA